MTTIVFIGPTLREPRSGLVRARDIHFAPPASCGDVYLACKRRPRAIGLVDGYFDHHLAVWHKEILWALASGIPVFGAASMGALRAAELNAFGMIGVGLIYEAFASGELEDDDEVAVVHDRAEDGFTPRSDAMVNLRATFAAARNAGIIQPSEALELTMTAKSMFYAERTLVATIQASTRLADSSRAALLAWVREKGLVDQKRVDALELLNVLCEPETWSGARPTSDFRLAETNYWNVLRRDLDQQAARRPAAASISHHQHRRRP